MLKKFIFVLLGIFAWMSCSAITIIATNNSTKNVNIGYTKNNSASYQYADSISYAYKTIKPGETVEYNDVKLHTLEKTSYIHNRWDNFAVFSVRATKLIQTPKHIRIQFLAQDDKNRGIHCYVEKIDIPEKGSILYIDYQGLNKSYSPIFNKKIV